MLAQKIVVSDVCKTCGCSCRTVDHLTNLHLHREIENLKQQVAERDFHIVKMESNLMQEADKYPNGEVAAMNEELLVWQEKYERLYEAHKKLQKVNQSLEDKLLKIVDKFETEKTALTRDVANLTRRLVESRVACNNLQEENERYKNDVCLAIQLLQCKPSNFVSQRIDSFPTDLQHKVKSYLGSKRRSDTGNTKHEVKTIKVPIPTFPPTAMVYSVNKNVNETEDDSASNSNIDIVSAAIMAKVLEEREKERVSHKQCDMCKPPSSLVDVGTQTLPSYVGERNRPPCAYCRNGAMKVYQNDKPAVHIANSRRRNASMSSNDSQSPKQSVSDANLCWSPVASTETEI